MNLSMILMNLDSAGIKDAIELVAIILIIAFTGWYFAKSEKK